MLFEWELRACALHYLKKHGDNAAIVATRRADELMAAGDLERARNVRAIVYRINLLLHAPGGPVN